MLQELLKWSDLAEDKLAELKDRVDVAHGRHGSALASLQVKTIQGSPADPR